MSFDDACRELGVTEAELEQLVAAGEIASIKEGDTLFFKKEVIRKFKKSRESEPTILLADEEVNLLDGEEIDLLDDDEGTTPTRKGATPPAAPKRATEPMEISLDDDAGLEDLDLEEEGAEKAAGPTKLPGPASKKQKKAPAAADTGDETLLNLDGLLEDDSEATTPVPSVDDSTLLDTDLLDLGGEGDPFSSDTVEETAADLTEQGTLLRGGGARVMQMKRKSSHAAWTVALALASLVLVLPLGVLLSLMFSESGVAKSGSPPAVTSWVKKFNILEGPVEALADMFRSSR
jgi:hypothetical protein